MYVTRAMVCVLTGMCVCVCSVGKVCVRVCVCSEGESVCSDGNDVCSEGNVCVPRGKCVL